MPPNEDITNEKRSITKGAGSRIESENYPAHGRAHEDDAIDMIHHHNEWGREKERGPTRRQNRNPITREGMSPTIEPRCKQ